jgi:hypothetical protein
MQVREERLGAVEDGRRVDGAVDGDGGPQRGRPVEYSQRPTCMGWPVHGREPCSAACPPVPHPRRAAIVDNGQGLPAGRIEDENALHPPPALPHALRQSPSMGNQHSRATTPTSNPTSPGVVAASQPSHGQALHYDSTRLHSHVPNPRRRESIQALSTVKASAAPPASTLESAAALTATTRPLSRGRAQTVNAHSSSTTAHVAHTLRAAHNTLKSASQEKMGNEQSRPKGSSRPLSPPKPKPSPSPSPLPALASKPANKPEPLPLPVPVPSPQTRPVAVPTIPREDTQTTRTEAAASLEPADASQNDYIVPSSHYNRPPRLPLPIEQEVITPGSPILSPADIAISIDHGDTDSALPRRSSVLSSTTADEDDLGDEFKAPEGQPTVPTVIEWEGPGERVYVTGTFAGWNRKYKLHRK